MSSSKRSRGDDDNDFVVIPTKADPPGLMRVFSSNTKTSKYSQMPKPELQSWLRENGQLVTGRRKDLLRACVDGEINGRIPGCMRCGKGQLHFDYERMIYVCNGFFDEEARLPVRCGFALEKVRREKWRNPAEDPPIPKGTTEKEWVHPATEPKHHREHPDHHHHAHHCTVEANHAIVDLFEDLAHAHHVLKDEKWAYKARAFIQAAAAIEKLDHEVKSVEEFEGRSGEDNHVFGIGKGSVEVIVAFLGSGKKKSSHLEDLNRQIKKAESIGEYDEN